MALKQQKTKNWPFDDPNYVCRVKTRSYTKVLRDGTEVKRTQIKHNIPLSELPDGAMRNMFTTNPPAREGNRRNSPNGNKRRNGKAGKWIRDKWKFVFTKLGLALIKDGQKNQVINPTSHKVLRGYLKTIPIHPPIKR